MYLHGEHRAYKGSTPAGGGMFGGDGGRQGVVTANAKSEEETPDAQLANDPAGAHAGGVRGMYDCMAARS